MAITENILCKPRGKRTKNYRFTEKEKGDTKNNKIQRKTARKKQWNRELQDSEKTINKMVILNPSLSTITLNVNRFNSLTKGHKVNEWILKKDPSTCFAQETHVRFKNTHLQKAKGCKKIF